MDALRTVAKLARMGDLAGIRQFLRVEKYVNRSVQQGFYDANRAMGCDLKLPDIEPLKIGPGEASLPSIYPNAPFRTPGKRKAA